MQMGGHAFPNRTGVRAVGVLAQGRLVESADGDRDFGSARETRPGPKRKPAACARHVSGAPCAARQAFSGMVGWWTGAPESFCSLVPT